MLLLKHSMLSMLGWALSLKSSTFGSQRCEQLHQVDQWEGHIKFQSVTNLRLTHVLSQGLSANFTTCINMWEQVKIWMIHTYNCTGKRTIQHVSCSGSSFGFEATFLLMPLPCAAVRWCSSFCGLSRSYKTFSWLHPTFLQIMSHKTSYHTSHGIISHHSPTIAADLTHFGRAQGSRAKERKSRGDLVIW